jgi:DNA-binding response OmpR family regulator
MAGERVLVVDDDPDIARFIEVNLRAHGFEVHLASTASRPWSGCGRWIPTWSWST